MLRKETRLFQNKDQLENRNNVFTVNQKYKKEQRT